MYELTPELRAELEGLDRLTTAELRDKYRALFGEEPFTRHRRFLQKRCAWGVQAAAFGGISEEARKRALEIARLSDIRLTPPATRTKAAKRVEVRSSPDPKLPPTGTALVRRYKGRDIRVTVLESGFEWDGRSYASLSAIAKTVTGTHCSGVAWFGLAKRKNGAA